MIDTQGEYIMANDAEILRGRVDGNDKYCRIPIRRCRSTYEDAKAFVQLSLLELNDSLNEYADDEDTICTINHAIACLLFLSDLLDAVAPVTEDGDG